MKEERRELTAEEEQRPYAKYFHQAAAEPNPVLMEILKKGPMDSANALMPEDINTLMEPGYGEAETGFCILPDGAGYVAVNNSFPGVTIDMVNWWFAWHGLEDMRYMLWFREGHHGIDVSDEDRSIILDPATPMVDKFQGRTHCVIEDVGNGIEDIRISFLTPEAFGFDIEKFRAGKFTLVAGNGISQARAGGPKAPAVMMHLFREVPGGVESRTRFWMGYHIIGGKAVKLLPDGVRIPVQAPMGLAFHNVEEYSNLAAILPGLYSEMEGRIF